MASVAFAIRAAAEEDAIEETAQLLRVPANAKRLLESLQQARSGRPRVIVVPGVTRAPGKLLTVDDLCEYLVVCGLRRRGPRG